jgi:hypothetical protein
MSGPIPSNSIRLHDPQQNDTGHCPQNIAPVECDSKMARPGTGSPSNTASGRTCFGFFLLFPRASAMVR